MAAIPKPTKRPKKYKIPAGTKATKCKACKAEICWVSTTNGRSFVNPDGTIHAETCFVQKGTVAQAYYPHSDTVDIVDVKTCARCGTDHKNIVFRKLGRPAKEFQWWSMCPVTAEPILMNMRVTKEEAKS